MMKQKWPLALAFTLSACGTELESNSSVQEVAPAGSNATFISSTFTAAMVPGERRHVQVVMQNSGASSPANDWAGSVYRMLSTQPGWQMSPALVRQPTVVGDTATLDFVVTAPDAGPPFQNFSAQMYHAGAGQSGFFGEQFVTNVDLTATLRQFECSEVSNNLPATLQPGETRAVTITVQNVGNDTWDNAFCLLRRGDVPGDYCVRPNTPVLHGDQYTFTVNVTAPATPGDYNMRYQMFQGGSVLNGNIGLFDVDDFCVDQAVTVAGVSAQDNATFEPQLSTIDDLLNLRSGDTVQVVATFRNTGNLPWPANSFRLYSRNTPANLWGPRTIIASDGRVVQPGDTYSFVFPVVVPEPGNHMSQWTLHGANSVPARFFGDAINISVTTSDFAPRRTDASLFSFTMPATMRPNEIATFEVKMQNDGQVEWRNEGGFRLVSANTPNNLWGVAFVDLPPNAVVWPQQSYNFTFTVRAPSTPGTYEAAWTMNQNSAFGGVGNFGALPSTYIVVQ